MKRGHSYLYMSCFEKRVNVDSHFSQPIFHNYKIFIPSNPHKSSHKSLISLKINSIHMFMIFLLWICLNNYLQISSKSPHVGENIWEAWIIILLKTSHIPTHYKAHPILRYKWKYVIFLITNSLKIHKINDLENTRAKPIFSYENGINEWFIEWWNMDNVKNGGRKRG